MKTFTYGQTPSSVIREALPVKYKIEFNRSDMLMILTVLREYTLGSRTPHVVEEAMSLRTSILETIGIEEI